MDLGLFKIVGYLDLGLFKIGGYLDLGLFKIKGATYSFNHANYAISTFSPLLRDFNSGKTISYVPKLNRKHIKM